MDREEQVLEFTNFLRNNGDDIVTLKKTNQSYVTFNKSKVETVDYVVSMDGNHVRVWFNDGSYEDLPNHNKEEIERIILS